MTDPELFKFDMRVRERMLKRGRLTDAELQRHIGALEDLDARCDKVEQPQPALGLPSEGGRPSVAPPAPHSDDDVEAS